MKINQWAVWILILGVVGGTGCSPLAPIPVQSETVHFSGGSTTGPLTIRRVELRFSNGQAETIVPRNGKLSTQAIIQFNGNGLFRASWLVDDRVVEAVSTTVTFGNTLTVDMAPPTRLPTFEPGQHRLTLRIEQPVSSLTIPTLIFMVTADENSEGKTQIK
ncbi:MAG: hypothetical protein HYR79_04730 [Nitrospirae bacterium]|nr:hypothetical protein [Nitrospirota bacterium]